MTTVLKITRFKTEVRAPVALTSISQIGLKKKYLVALSRRKMASALNTATVLAATPRSGSKTESEVKMLIIKLKRFSPDSKCDESVLSQTTWMRMSKMKKTFEYCTICPSKGSMKQSRVPMIGSHRLPSAHRQKAMQMMTRNVNVS